jgi:excisionase family DNA binding protein
MPTSPNAIDRLEALVERLERVTAPGPEFATVGQASELLGIGTKALRGAIQRGEIPVYHLGTRVGGRRRVHLPEVRSWALGTARDPLAEVRAAGDAAARESLHRESTR